jgi:hypothetical protein
MLVSFNLSKSVVNILVLNINEAKMLHVGQCRELSHVKAKSKFENNFHVHSAIIMNQNLEQKISLMKTFYLREDQQTYLDVGDDQ